MMTIFVIFAMILLFSLTNCVSNEKEKDLKEAMTKAAKEHGIDPDNLKPGQVFMLPPEMTEEEEGSRQMPQAYHCSGCMAVAYQLQKAFSAAEKKIKKGQNLPYADILEITEDVCERRMSGYGLKNMNGRKVLSGEGLKHDKDSGIMEAGGKWEVRLKTLCQELIELYEEEGIYDKYDQRGDGKLDVTLCSSYCSQKERREEL